MEDEFGVKVVRQEKLKLSFGNFKILNEQSGREELLVNLQIRLQR